MKRTTIFSLIISILPAISFASNTPEPASQETRTIENPIVKNDRSADMFNIRIEPHWLLIDEIATDFQIKFGGNFGVGPILAYMSGGDGIYSGGSISSFIFGDYETTRATYGLRAVYYFSGNNRSSALISIKATKSDSKVEAKKIGFLNDNSGKGSFSETMAGITGGYQWQWNRITLNIGGGFGFYDTPERINLIASDGTVTTRSLDSDRGTTLLLDLGLGLSF